MRKSGVIEVTDIVCVQNIHEISVTYGGMEIGIHAFYYRLPHCALVNRIK
jgi:hypothetical protein